MYIQSNQTHLTLSDRMFIDSALRQRLTFREMALTLQKDPSTISKEIRSHRKQYSITKPNRITCSHCMNYTNCQKKNLCSKNCRQLCRVCNHGNISAQKCISYHPFDCKHPDSPPYVCNGCEHLERCTLKRYVYHPKQAQQEYEVLLRNSRKGINMTLEELEELNALISPLILKGQPLSHIYAVHGEEIPCTRRTLYNYLDQRVFQAKNIDLPRRVRYKKRKKKQLARNKDQQYRIKRTYKDFERFMEDNPDTQVVEMDTVKGNNESGQCLLTFLFCNSGLLLIRLIPACSQAAVCAEIDTINDTLGDSMFRKVFPVILTDNGSEFKNPNDMEHHKNLQSRTKVFYCDPYASNQKGRLERTHEFIRYVIPKGKTMRNYSADDIILLNNHINGLARDSLNGSSPFDIASVIMPKKVLESLGLKYVSPDNILLKPALLNNNKESSENH